LKQTTQLVLAPAQRADLVDDFSQWPGEELVLENRSDVLFKGFAPHNPTTTIAIVVPPLSEATVSGHPIHLHLVEFQVLGRQPFKGTGTPKYHNGTLREDSSAT